MKIYELCDNLSTPEQIFGFLRNLGLLRQVPPICGRDGCNRRMTQVKDDTCVFDGYRWRCPKHKGNKVSLRAGSFFEKAHFSLRDGILMAYFWALSKIIN